MQNETVPANAFPMPANYAATWRKIRQLSRELSGALAEAGDCSLAYVRPAGVPFPVLFGGAQDEPDALFTTINGCREANREYCQHDDPATREIEVALITAAHGPCEMGCNPDRLAFLIQSYNNGVAAYAARDDFRGIDDERQFCATAMDQWFDQIEDWNGPAQTRTGAMLALKLAMREATYFEASPIVLPLIKAALEYLEGEAAGQEGKP